MKLENVEVVYRLIHPVVPSRYIEIKFFTKEDEKLWEPYISVIDIWLQKQQKP